GDVAIADHGAAVVAAQAEAGADLNAQVHVVMSEHAVGHAAVVAAAGRAVDAELCVAQVLVAGAGVSEDDAEALQGGADAALVGANLNILAVDVNGVRDAGLGADLEDVAALVPDADVAERVEDLALDVDIVVAGGLGVAAARRRVGVGDVDLGPGRIGRE